MISIIIPTYNEADNIISLINQISLVLRGNQFEIIVVDDNSPDKTWAIVSESAKINPHIKLVHRTKERGLTSAFNAGIKASSGSIVGWLDADLSHPPKLLSKMVKLIKTNDAVVASRYLKNASDERGLFLAVLFSRIINKLAQVLLFFNITDYTSGYILVKKNYLTKLRGDYGEYFINLIYDLKQKQAKIIEIPYISQNRIHGQSKTATNLLGFIKRGYKYIFTILNLWSKKL
jgi:dolichol-phosphate mannosyltransferase